MSYSSILSKALLIFLYCCCCSFSAIPAPQPPQKAPPTKTKRQLRQQKRQQKKLLRAQKRLSKRLEKPKKNHATFNILGFVFVLGGPVLFFASLYIILTTLGIYGTLVSTLIAGFGIISIALVITGIVFCILGLVGHKEAEKPQIGFGIAGLVIVGIPIVVAIVALFAAYVRSVI